MVFHFNMPSKPENKKLWWVKERVPFGRRKDNTKFYNATRWRKTSAAYRDANPTCEECKRNNRVGPAQVCDHIKGLDYLLRNNLDPYNWDELQSLCHPCHNSKSGKESHK